MPNTRNENGKRAKLKKEKTCVAQRKCTQKCLSRKDFYGLRWLIVKYIISLLHQTTFNMLCCVVLICTINIRHARYNSLQMYLLIVSVQMPHRSRYICCMFINYAFPEEKNTIHQRAYPFSEFNCVMKCI